MLLFFPVLQVITVNTEIVSHLRKLKFEKFDARTMKVILNWLVVNSEIEKVFNFEVLPFFKM